MKALLVAAVVVVGAGAAATYLVKTDKVKVVRWKDGDTVGIRVTVNK